MPDRNFLDCDAFRQIVEEYYPTDLRDRETRWRVYSERLRPYSQAAEQVVQAIRVRVLSPLLRLVNSFEPPI